MAGRPGPSAVQPPHPGITRQPGHRKTKGRTMTGSEHIGQLLKVDLDAHTCTLSSLPKPGRKFLGGRGFNIWYLYNHLACSIDPLSRENILMFSCGLLTGSSAPSSARLHINALSPLTGILGSSNIGGYAGPWLRSCNILSLAVTGVSKSHVYLHITDKGVQLKDASMLWGLDALETQKELNRLYTGKKIKVLTIGPGGENRVRFAAVITEKDHAAGRTGMGAVMGAKRLKAIVIEKGCFNHFKASTPEQKSAVRAYASKIKSADEFSFFSKFGGAGYIDWVNDFGIMGSKNYSQIGTDHVRNVDGRRLEKNVIKKSGCFKCPIQCKADIRLDADTKKRFTRPEFEPLINLGPKCGLENLEDIVRLDNLCTRLGIDSTSASGAIAFAMDLFAHDKLPKDLLWDEGTKGNLDLSWGNARTMEILIFQMVENRGLGSLLRLGVRAAAQRIGKGAKAHAAHVKGLELTAYHPGAIMGTALGYAVSSRGGDYNNVYASLEYSWTRDEAQKEFGTKDAVDIKSIAAKGELIKKAVTTNIIVDSIGLCKVPVLSLLRSFNLEAEAELIKGLTGLNLTHQDLREIGCRIASLERLFNLRHTTEDQKDRLPDMFIGSRENQITEKNFQVMVAEFYRAMGWDEKGVPVTLLNKGQNIAEETS